MSTKVLISKGWGYTWGYGNYERATDEGLVALVERCAPLEVIREYVEAKWPDECQEGLDSLEVHEVPTGELWQIQEYDGSECLVIFNKANWNVG